MSQQQYDYPPPPPPPHSPGSAGLAPNAQPVGRPGALQRRRPISGILPPAIATNLLGTPGASTGAAGPYSAITFSGSQQQLYTPASPTPWAAGGSATPMEPYNPRQWTHRGQVSGSQMIFHQRGSSGAPNLSEMSGMEAAMPSPPPPYTPGIADRAAASPRMENVGFTSSPLANEAVRQSPQIPMSPAFPPPPGPSSRQRDRSSSGIAGQRGFFGLGGLRGKQPAVADPQPAPFAGPSTQSPMELRPPAARRAASAGHMQTHNAAGPSSAAAHTSPAGRDSPESGWQPGMPLPGPPPGPPPPGNRSQSLNRPVGASSSLQDTDRNLEAPRPRRGMPASTLGPIPPTPADWVTGAPNPQNLQMRPAVVDGATMEPLRIDTGSNRESSLTRRPAKRGDSSSGLRDRRSRSRAAKGSDADAGPSNLVFSPIEGSISRRREHARTGSNFVNPDSSSASGTADNASGSSGSTAKGGETVLTPPYSAGRNTDDQLRRQVLRLPGSAASDRPMSQLLHAAHEENGLSSAQLSPGRPPSSGSLKPSTAKLDSFAVQAIERHRSFVEREIAANSDEERLELFANYLVHESRIRRDRYTAAYNAMAGDIVDLTRDMWRSYNKSTRRAGTPSTTMSSYDPTLPSWASDGQPNSARDSSFGDHTPATDSASGDGGDGDNRQWPEAFKPSLSPIPSMTVSTIPDEDSRGRSASRWWEQSASGSGSIGRPDRIEKSRRETKYMGVNLATLQDSDPDTARATPNGARAGQPLGYGPDEYPPEKVGWHEGYDYDTPMATPHRSDRHTATPGAEPLDVSRLVTLPPPYPRHHPAVNNNHPLLADLRSEHRILAQYEECTKIKDVFREKEAALIRDQQEAAKQRRAKLRGEVQSEIAAGTMSFADAAKAEADFDVEEDDKMKADVRSRFELFESSVAHPLNTLLTERLKMGDSCIKRLSADLESDHGAANPDQAQEEGDERPERLEKLTLLKWLFEAREQLHKEMFDLHAMRSDQYAEVILTPYRAAKQQSKIDEAKAFFKRDARQRQVNFTKESLQRFEDLQAFVDKNVTRGVEDQLSAFWDIAPGLLEVVQHIPLDMSTLDIMIPPQEYSENPAYHQHPLQYLYTLLNHAQKSAYQFIESQVNLLCLLHEVKTATSKASLRVLELETTSGSPDDRQIHAEMQQARQTAESQLTMDLKEKVGEVERQWREALGNGLAECRMRVGAYLEANGGLDDGLEV